MAKQFSKKPSFLKHCWKFTKCAALIMFVSSLLYIIVCKWVMPPITITQITNGFSYGLKRDYVGWNEMSYNVKLAAIASEDQAFPDHNGFDLDAIKKSFNPKKGKKKKLPLGAATSTITQQTAKNVFLFGGGGLMKYVRKVPEAYFTLLIEFI